MSDLRMGEVISQINEQKLTLRGRVKKFFGRVKARIAWSLWGRRQALRKMQRLALAYPPARRTPEMIDAEHRRLRDYRRSLDREPIPTPRPPEVDDTGMN
jgi:hypothetical protein